MDEKTPQTDPLRSDCEAALAEERRLWRAIHDPELSATARVLAYARWRVAFKRLNDLAVSPRPGGAATGKEEKMNSTAEFERGMGGLPTGSEMSDAIDVIALLTEQAERMAGNGEKELAMSQALSATFEYMVAYCHHLTMEQREPHDALAKAAAGIPELDAADLDFLRAVSRELARRAT